MIELIEYVDRRERHEFVPSLTPNFTTCRVCGFGARVAIHRRPS